MKLRFLGTGDSGQVPVYNCECSACVRAAQDDSWRRRPCSAVLECGDQRWLIDSGRMDLTELFPPGSLTGILQTHYHADHAQGLLHLRWGVNCRIPVYGPEDPQGFADLFKHSGILDFSQYWKPFEQRKLGDMLVTAIPLQHSRPCLGYVFSHQDKHIAYLTDTVGLPPDSLAYLQTLSFEYCIVDCSHPPQSTPPRNHNDLNMALEIGKQLRVQHLVLTHISHKVDVWLMENPQTLGNSILLAKDNGMIEV